MRCKVLLLLVVGLFVTICAPKISAQGTEQEPLLFIVEEDVVKPSMVDQFEEHIRGGIAQFARYKFPYPQDVYCIDGNHYFFSYPVKNFEGIGNLYKAAREYRQKIGEEQWKLRVKSAAGTLEYYQSTLFYLSFELSYSPETPRPRSEQRNFVYWTYLYVEHGKEKEFEEVLKAWVELYKSKNISHGFATYMGSIGNEMPLYVIAESAKSAAAFYSQEDETFKLFGEEGQALMKKTWALLRKFEIKIGNRRPDLSYRPEER
ncbi:MAG: hypothetical protein OEZ30_09070 [Candidatus Aminicenantes bacterium]|nr:hypothetical protein [Candidatus Aminicenantes bacterium]